MTDGMIMAHIPQSPTTDIDILTFNDALTRHGEDDYDRDRWLYVPDFYSEYRYILGTRGKNPLIAIGINPSTAKPDDLDNTLKSVERIALGNGYDSFIMFNVYAQRATDPDKMENEFNEKLHRENMKAFDYVLSLSKKPHIWAAWGTIILKRPYLPLCVLDMITLGERHNAEWYTCGARSKSGSHPHHPLYLRKDLPLEAFDASSYIDSLTVNLNQKNK